MNSIVLALSNLRPDKGSRRYEHLHPEKNPRWRFAQLFDGGGTHNVPTGEGGLLLAAVPHGPRVGSDASGPLALWVVLTNPADGREDEYNAWYDGRHISDTLALPGLTAAQRYAVRSIDGPEDTRWAYLAIYEVELERVDEALADGVDVTHLQIEAMKLAFADREDLGVGGGAARVDLDAVNLPDDFAERGRGLAGGGRGRPRGPGPWARPTPRRAAAHRRAIRQRKRS